MEKVNKTELKQYLTPRAYEFMRGAVNLPRKLRRKVARDSVRNLIKKLKNGEVE